MRADHILRPGCGAGDLVDVEGRGVGGEQRPRLRHPVELGEDPFLEVHLLEHRLDHDIGMRRRIEPDGAVDQAHAALDLAGGEPAAGGGRPVIGGDPVEPLLQSVAAGLDQRDRDAGIGEAHRDAAAHRAGADHRGAVDRPRLCPRPGSPGAFAASRSAKKTWRCAFD